MAIWAITLFVVVLALVITRPGGLPIGWTALIGGLLAWLTGLVSTPDIVEVVRLVWDATLTFVAVILISLILDAIGLFHWAALGSAHLAGTRGSAVLWFLGLLGAAVAMFFANDGAALILTPIVYEQAKALKLPTPATLALIMASGFIADTTSLPLVVSNLVNIVSADFFHLGFASYALVMVPVDLLALALSLAVLWLYYGRALPSRVNTGHLPPAASAIRDLHLFRMSWAVLALLLLGYFASQWLRWPVSVFAGAAAAWFVAAAWRRPTLNTRQVLREAPWNIVAFSLGMYVVVYGLRNAGLTHALSSLILWYAGHGAGTLVVGTGLTAAVASAVMNNMPTVMINALAIHGAHLSASLERAAAYANVIGCDLGPKLTPIGSLATLLWLHVLDRRDLHIGWGYYVTVGATLTLPVLLITLLGLWGWTALIG
ncbi:MAG: arsenic transporter [Firmicutes bacterium]|nr:arsenic transporter [Bacillota bacterium]